MKRKYHYRELTIEMIKEYGIDRVDKDGTIYRKGKILKPSKIYTKNKNNPIYLKIALKGGYPVCVHRVVWLWFANKKDDSVTKIPVGYDIDHIDNNALNNHVDNLQILNRRENLYKAVVQNGRLRPDNQIELFLPKKKIYTMEYIDSKIKYHEAKAESLKALKTDYNRAEINRKLITAWGNHSKWTSIKRYYIEHKILGEIN